jgi:hypothetical protein
MMTHFPPLETQFLREPSVNFFFHRRHYTFIHARYSNVCTLKDLLKDIFPFTLISRYASSHSSRKVGKETTSRGEKGGQEACKGEKREGGNYERHRKRRSTQKFAGISRSKGRMLHFWAI